MFKRAVFIQFYLLCLYPFIVQILQFSVDSVLHLGLLFTWLWPSNNSETRGCQTAAIHSSPEFVSPACQIWTVLLWLTVVLGNISDCQSAVWKWRVCKKIVEVDIGQGQYLIEAVIQSTPVQWGGAQWGIHLRNVLLKGKEQDKQPGWCCFRKVVYWLIMSINTLK